MNPKLKLAAYAVLIILTAWFGHDFYKSYRSSSAPSSTAKIAPHPKKSKTNDAPAIAIAVTNTNAVDTNLTVGAVTTNATDQPINTANAPAPVTDTNQIAAAPISDSKDSDPVPTTMADTITGAHQGKTILYMLLFIASALGLGLLITIDVTSMVGEKAGEYLFSNVGDGARDPEYDKAEDVWADGKHLEAIQMMRDYYKRNPRQVHAALRIAEIYEKDLKNYLAAALEYEEVLKKNLPDDRWGRAAIHLCNLYSRLGQQDKTMALLRRIAGERPKSAAATKARQRLGLAEPDEAPTAEAAAAASGEDEEKPFEVTEENGEWPADAPEASTPPADEPKSNLPSGFRPKKK